MKCLSERLAQLSKVFELYGPQNRAGRASMKLQRSCHLPHVQASYNAQ